jgi:ribosomal protein L17
MKHSKIRQGVYLATAVALAAVTIDHVTNTRGVQAQIAREPFSARPIGPAPIDDLQSAINQTAAIVEGVVVDIQYDYSEEEGPWTRVILSKARARAGDVAETIEIRHFGGPLPNGGLMVAAELPVFVLGKEYIVFLRNTPWNVSPVVGDLAFRIETVNDTEVLVDSDGQPVVEIGAGGFERGAALFEGPERDGAAPKPIDGALRASGRKPLDRESFMKSLEANLTAQQLRVAGTFYEKPGGEFHWRDLRVVQSPDTIVDPLAGSREPEADASELKRF